MAKRYITLKTDDGDLRLRVSFNVAAEFEEDQGVRVYGGDQDWLRNPKALRRFVFLAARAQHEDLDEDAIGDMLSGQDFQVIVNTVAEAILGENPGKGGGGKGKQSPSRT